MLGNYAAWKSRLVKKPWTLAPYPGTLYVMVIHVPLPLFNAELRESPVWRNVWVRGEDDRVW